MKPRSYTDEFYNQPSPEGAVSLAIADHKALTKQSPQWEYIAQLQEAERRCKAYPKLIEALRRFQNCGLIQTDGHSMDTAEPHNELLAALDGVNDVLREHGKAA